MKVTTDPAWLADQESASLLEDDFGSLPDSPSDSLTVTAFDDLVVGTGPVTVVTNAQLDGVLGAFDQLVIQVVVDIVGGVSPTLTCAITHSGDGQYYVTKRSVPEIPATPLSTTGTNILPLGYDDGNLPSLAFVRVVMTLGGTGTVSGRIVCTITGNNVHEMAFTQKVQQYADTAYAGGCTSIMTGGTKVSFELDEWGSLLANRDPRMTAADKYSAGAIPWTQWFKRIGPPPVTAGSKHIDTWTMYQLKQQYRICFRTDKTVAVLSGAKVVYQSQNTNNVQYKSPQHR